LEETRDRRATFADSHNCKIIVQAKVIGGEHVVSKAE
jgi:hypothetical protein